MTTRTQSVRYAIVASCALLCWSFAGCGESQPPAPPAPSKVIEKKLDSKDPNDRMEGAKQAEKLYGNGESSDKNNAPPAPPSSTDK